MTVRVSPGPRFSRISEPSRASWKGFSAPSRRPRFERYSRAERTAVCMRLVRLRRSRCLNGAAPPWIYGVRSMHVFQLTSAQLKWPFARKRLVLGTTRFGANIATGLHPRLAAHFSAATPGYGELNWMWKRPEPVRSSSWEPTISRRSWVAARAFHGRGERQHGGEPRGRFSTAIAGRSGRESDPVATSSRQCSRFGLRQTDSCRIWFATSLVHCCRWDKVSDIRNGWVSYSPAGTAGSARLLRRPRDSRSCELALLGTC